MARVIEDWTYTNQPETVPLDLIRLQVGDTDPTDKLLSDAECNSFLASKGPTFAAADAADAIGAYYSRQVTKTVGKLSMAMSSMAAQYFKLAKQLRAQGARSVIPYVGGISLSDKRTQEMNTDRVAPSFSRNLMDFPGDAVPQDTENTAGYPQDWGE